MEVLAMREDHIVALHTNDHETPISERLFGVLPRLFGYFYPRVGGDRQTAEDLTQDVMLSAVRSAKAPGSEDELMAWLFAIARNRLIDHYRQQDRQQRNLGQRVDDAVIEDQPALPDLDLESSAVRDEVTAVLGMLSPNHRAAIVLKYLDGRDTAEVGQALFLSPVAASSLLARARNAFRTLWIERNGGYR